MSGCDYRSVVLRDGWTARVWAAVDRGVSGNVSSLDGGERTCNTVPGPEPKRTVAEPGTGALGSEAPGTLTGAETDVPTVDQWRDLLNKLLENPAGLPGYEPLKYSQAGEVLRAELVWDGGSVGVVCKRTRLRGLRRRLAGAVRATRERAHFDKAFRLLRAGVGTAAPLALLEAPASQGEAWLITRFLNDLIDLDRLALVLLPGLAPNRARAVKKAVGCGVVDLLVRLERAGLHHRDLKASNILLSNWDSPAGDLKVLVLDLEGVRRRVPFGSKRRWNCLVRLGASLLEYGSVTRCDHARFVKAYVARIGHPPESWRHQYRVLARRAHDYARRSWRRKTHKLDGHTGEA